MRIGVCKSRGRSPKPDATYLRSENGDSETPFSVSSSQHFDTSVVTACVPTNSLAACPPARQGDLGNAQHAGDGERLGGR